MWSDEVLFGDMHYFYLDENLYVGRVQYPSSASISVVGSFVRLTICS